VALMVAGTLTSCGSSGLSVELEDSSQATGGKALLFKASTDAKLSGTTGGYFGVELRGIDVTRAERATYDRPDYRNKTLCFAPPCEWTVVPDAAGKYEFRAFLIDQRNKKSAAKSGPVEVEWAAPPQPHALELLINGKSMPIQSFDGDDEYIPIRAGKLRLEGRWTTDARGTGYQVAISADEPDNHVYARCSTGTSCVVPVEVPIRVDQELTWEIKVLTKRGGKLVAGGRVCLSGQAA
jgi:hypothetical protein